MFERTLHRIVSHPWAYDLLQRSLGCEQSLRKVTRLVADLDGKTVLDVGAGTGNGARACPGAARYLWLDNDLQKLSGFRAGNGTRMAILCDATSLALKNKSVDAVLCIAMCHHLEDAQALELFRELARVCRTRMVFLDPVEQTSSRWSRLLWKYDRGSHARPAGALRAMVERHFDIEYEEDYAIYHHYWLCSARPRLVI